MKERTRQHLMAIYQGALTTPFVWRADWPERLYSALVAHLVERAGDGYGIAVWEYADRTADRFMRERGHYVGKGTWRR